MTQSPNELTQRRGNADGDASPNKLARSIGQPCPNPAKVAQLYRAQTGKYVSPSRVRRAFAHWKRQVARGDFLPWFITYADPTGETAVHSVVSGGAR